jgi:RNA polymerase sigma-70 factor (ECF subfamily)
MSVFRDDIVALLPHLRGFARSLTGGNASFADDLVQDAVVNAMDAQHQFQPGTNLKAWMFTILRNRFHSLVTRKHRTAEVPADETIENKWWQPAYQETSIEIDAFKRAFKMLSVEHREALVLATIHELPYEQIAKICNCEVGTVKSRVSRARTLLKQMMLEEDLPVTPSKVSGRKVAPRIDRVAPKETRELIGAEQMRRTVASRSLQ